VLSLLSEAAEEHAVVCLVDDDLVDDDLVDDEQWLDRATGARVRRPSPQHGVGGARLRHPCRRQDLAGVPELVLESRLVEFGTRVQFRHPLARSAVYHAASLPERQDVHRALADVTDPELDPDRRAWHLARATPGPDEGVTSGLEQSAGRAQVRGGLAAAAAFLERAATLTPEPRRIGDRVLHRRFACIFALNIASPRDSRQLAMTLLFGVGLLLGLALGLALGPVLSGHAKADPSALWQAAGATAVFVAALGALGYAVRRDLTVWARTLFWALVAPIVFAIVAIFVSIPQRT
jgi:hypothetical protein